jgi:hypothetical protein
MSSWPVPTPPPATPPKIDQLHHVALGRSLVLTPPPATPPKIDQGVIISRPGDLQAAQTARVNAYRDALARLQPAWSALPTAPYPPSSDTTDFPRTGSPELIVRKSAMTAAQLAEPGKVTQGLNQQALARRPKLNAYFLVGAACLTAYLVLR